VASRGFKLSNPAGEGGADESTEILDLHPSPAAHLAMGVTLSHQRVLQNQIEFVGENDVANGRGPHDGDSQNEDLGHFD
jgi:hypothetical protein